MNVEIYIYNFNALNMTHDETPTHLGHIEVERFDAEEIFNMCNWICWAEEKPKNLYANIDCCGHGLCLLNPETQDAWLAKSFGWLVGKQEVIDEYVREHKHCLVWE